MRKHSPLCTYVSLSPHRNSPRNHSIDTITIHCTAGLSTLDGIDATFNNPARPCSANYAIDSFGHIGCYVPEGDRSWASSNAANDNRAITIEIVSESLPPYKCTESACKALVGLLVDICKEYNIPEIKWKNDKTLIGKLDFQNVTIHRWFANTACPGEYLLSHFDNIFFEVNKRLKPEEYSDYPLYRVQVGAYRSKQNAEYLLAELCKQGYTDAFMVETNGPTR